MKNNENFLPFLAIAFIAFILFFDANKSIQEKTIYLEYCDDLKHNSYSCPTLTKVSKLSFKIFVEQQMVVTGTFNPEAYRKCVVFDKDNWTCDKGAGKIISISNGSFYESHSGSIGKDGQTSSLPLGSQIPFFFYYFRSVVEFLQMFSR